MKNQDVITFFSFLILGLCYLTGCALPRSINFDKKTFDKNYNKWKSLAVENYTFTHSSTGFSTYSMNITIQNKKVTNVSNENSKYEAKNIDDYFNEILNFYHQNHNKKHTNQDIYYTNIIVSYNEVYGFPEKWHYTVRSPNNLTVDGNFSFNITNFKIHN